MQGQKIPCLRTNYFERKGCRGRADNNLPDCSEQEKEVARRGKGTQVKYLLVGDDWSPPEKAYQSKHCYSGGVTVRAEKLSCFFSFPFLMKLFLLLPFLLQCLRFFETSCPCESIKGNPFPSYSAILPSCTFVKDLSLPFRLKFSVALVAWLYSPSSPSPLLGQETPVLL